MMDTVTGFITLLEIQTILQIYYFFFTLISTIVHATKRWMDCVQNDMKEKGVSDNITDDRTAWKKKTCCADATLESNERHTCILASVSPVCRASSSRVYTSGYCVRWKALSNASSCSPVNVVRERRCFLFSVNPGSESMSDESEPRPEIKL